MFDFPLDGDSVSQMSFMYSDCQFAYQLFFNCINHVLLYRFEEQNEGFMHSFKVYVILAF